jgi:hypothetical protein
LVIVSLNWLAFIGASCFTSHSYQHQWIGSFSFRHIAYKLNKPYFICEDWICYATSSKTFQTAENLSLLGPPFLAFSTVHKVNLKAQIHIQISGASLLEWFQAARQACVFGVLTDFVSKYVFIGDPFKKSYD